MIIVLRSEARTARWTTSAIGSWRWATAPTIRGALRTCRRGRRRRARRAPRLESLECVESVTPILKPYKLASRRSARSRPRSAS